MTTSYQLNKHFPTLMRLLDNYGAMTATLSNRQQKSEVILLAYGIVIGTRAKCLARSCNPNKTNWGRFKASMINPYEFGFVYEYEFCYPTHFSVCRSQTDTSFVFYMTIIVVKDCTTGNQSLAH